MSYQMESVTGEQPGFDVVVVVVVLAPMGYAVKPITVAPLEIDHAG